MSLMNHFLNMAVPRNERGNTDTEANIVNEMSQYDFLVYLDAGLSLFGMLNSKIK